MRARSLSTRRPWLLRAEERCTEPRSANFSSKPERVAPLGGDDLTHRVRKARPVWSSDCE